MVDVQIAGLSPGLAIVRRIPRSAGSTARVVLHNIGAVAFQNSFAGGASFVFMSTFRRYWMSMHTHLW